MAALISLGKGQWDCRAGHAPCVSNRWLTWPFTNRDSVKLLRESLFTRYLIAIRRQFFRAVVLNFRLPSCQDFLLIITIEMSAIAWWAEFAQLISRRKL